MLKLNKYHDNLYTFNGQSNISNKNALNILNVRGLNNSEKFDELIYFINECKVDVDIIIIGETWLKKEYTVIYNIPGYRSYFSCRENSSGGLAMFIRSTVEHKLIECYEFNGLHYLRMEIKLQGQLFDIIGVYRPPSYDYNEFLNTLEGWLSTASPTRPVLVIGDVNIPVNLQNNNVVVRYKSLLESYAYTCTNTFPTRPASNNTLDHFICPIDITTKLQNHTIFSDISDHLPIISSLSLRNEKRQQTLKTNIVDHEKLRNLFNAFLSNFRVSDDVDASLNALITSYNNILAACTKSLTRVIRVKNEKCPWMTYGLWRLIQIKNNYLVKLKRHPTDVNTREMLSHISKKVKVAKIHTKRQYYKDLLDSSNNSNVWKNLNNIFGRLNVNDSIKLLMDGQIVDSNYDVAEVFNDFFSQIGNNLATQLPENYFDYLKHVKYVRNSIFLTPASEDEVSLLINQLDIKKSNGQDNFPASIVKANIGVFSDIITRLFNKIIVTGTYPNILKIAKVIPVYKSGDPCDPSNYRPISTLSVFNKILEKLLTNRLVKFFCANNVLYKFQYGFREGCSTMTAVTELMDELVCNIDSKKIVGGLFIDLKKAFDTINHEILLQKLDRYGIRGVANDLIKSYLSERKQFVIINNVRSSTQRINIGVPQGSNIGPLLFLIFINDIGNLKLHGIPRLFADDTALFYPRCSIPSIVEDMESDLTILSEFFNGNRLSLNLNKTKYMIFHSSRKKVLQYRNPCIGDISVEKVDSFKYLGLFLDSHLSWECHIKYISSKVSSLCGLMKRVRCFVSTDALLRFYYACIHSIFQYLIIVWGHAAKSKLKKIQTLQNRCAKVIFNLPHLYPTLSLYSSLLHRIIPILGLRDCQTIMFVHNVLHNSNFHNNLNFSSRINLQNTRHANELLRVRAYTNLGATRIMYYGPLKFNALPYELKSISNKITLKTKLKHHILRNVNEYIL